MNCNTGSEPVFVPGCISTVGLYLHFVPPNFAAELVSSLFAFQFVFSFFYQQVSLSGVEASDVRLPPSVRHIPRIGYQLHPNPRCAASSASWATYGRDEAAPALLQARAARFIQLLCESPEPPPPLRHRAPRRMRKRHGRLLEGRAFPPAGRLLPQTPLITGKWGRLEVHTQLHIS